MRFFSLMAIAVLTILWTGCPAVDSQILAKLQEYFPLATLEHQTVPDCPQNKPCVLIVHTNVANTTTKFLQSVTATLLRQNCCKRGLGNVMEDLDVVLPASGTRVLIVTMSNNMCAWYPVQNVNVIRCKPQGSNEWLPPYSIYSQMQ